MPPARKPAATKPATRATRAANSVRARAASTSAATRREVEQSITRFEKRLDDANDALKTLGTHLGRGAQGSYKDLTTALATLRRDAAKTNRQALKDFDKLRTAITQKAPAASKSSSAAKKSTTARSTAAKPAAAKSSSGSSRGSSRSTATGKTTSRAKTTRARKTS
jgi:predicted  nucleic acid-binding Zn-ribbon protein